MIIITPNRRLAAFSQNHYQKEQLAAQLQSWETAEIYSIESWLLQLWQLCLECKPSCYRPLLSKLQQQQLFEQIIQNSSESIALLRVNAAAQNVMQAWSFLQQWQVGLDKVQPYADFSPDTAAFIRWMQDYLKWLDDNDFYDLNLMVDVLIANLTSIKKYLPAAICLRGFNELTPQYAKLFAALESCGIDISSDQLIDTNTAVANIGRCGFANVEDEFRAAAAWASQELQLNPEQIIGVVVPELEKMRAVVSNAFIEYLPNALVNISAPLPLNSYSLIDIALLILELAKPVINFNDLSILLRSPFVGKNITSSNERAILDRLLRDKLEAKTSWKVVYTELATLDLHFADCTSKFIAQLESLQGQHYAEYWVQRIQQLLQCWEWPNLTTQERVFTAIEADLLGCWRDLLSEYCNVGVLLQKHNFMQALQTLQRLALEIPFLPAETGLTKVHVLGVLEADGIPFDKLWVCGMTRDSWPMDASPNPFIPLEIQREYDLPRSSASRELMVAKRLTANLMQGGKTQVIFSYPLFADDQPIAPSNLITTLPLLEITAPELNNDTIIATLETWRDDKAPELNVAYISGGTKVLRLQAQCPFKANAELRLLANPLAEPKLFLTPADRGSLVHEVLENFWKQCKSHAQLLQWLPHKTSEVLHDIIQKALGRWQAKRPFTLNNSYMQLEAQRLLELISRWLSYEAARDPFVVAQLEQKVPIQVGALQINMQVDRIDQLQDNSYAIIDYKTGDVMPSEWFSDPIYEPQLPLYAVYANDNVTAVAVAVLQPNVTLFRGVSATDGLLPNVKKNPDWQQLKQEWQMRLQTTALQFMQGEAPVKPYAKKVCNYCALQGLCRIYD